MQRYSCRTKVKPGYGSGRVQTPRHMSLESVIHSRPLYRVLHQTTVLKIRIRPWNQWTDSQFNLEIDIS